MKELDLIETEIEIKYIKDTFEKSLAKKLNLIRVSAPLFVTHESGLNDNLNGVERTIDFDVNGVTLEIVQSLAKWKRDALKRYNFEVGSGLYTDMNAIRRDETLDNLHSIYVDQWDWEKIISESDRNKRYLFKTVKQIYSVIYKLSVLMNKKYGYEYNLTKDIHFVSAKDLENMYPEETPKMREYLITKEYRAVFIYSIGWPLKNKMPHDGRAADYDDWKLNGDIILFDDAIDSPIELSSMGIRVNKESLVKQLKHKGELDKLNNPYCTNIMNDNLPQTIGGGIGQSRLCMFYLKKKHISEVQSSYWTDEIKEELKSKNINVL
ncbi:MAG: aspartate--ammonia ligase [Gammaproteobacteria bacterium]|nr:aspartate--ammonia ligase [Gammaproteobacteria bacterium]